MDPNANLRELIESALAFIAWRDMERDGAPDMDEVEQTLIDCDRMAELVLALVQWKAGGGFDPRWSELWEEVNHG